VRLPHRPSQSTTLFLAIALTLAVSTGSAQTTLFTDNFEDGVADGWTVFQGQWLVVTDGNRVYRQAGLSSKYRSAAGSSAWTDYAVQARVKPTQWNGSDRFCRARGALPRRQEYLLARTAQQQPCRARQSPGWRQYDARLAQLHGGPQHLVYAPSRGEREHLAWLRQRHPSGDGDG
jgi:hypothetical protein